MKRIFQYIGMVLGVVALLTSCESDFEKTTMSMTGECKLMATATQADIALENYYTPVLQLVWTSPRWYSNDNTRLAAGVGVSFYVQASTDESFSNFTETVANGLSMTFTAANLNSTAKKLAMEIGKKAPVYLRVKCLEGGNIDVYSNVCQVEITPIYINMTKLAVLNAEKNDTIGRLVSPEENGVYTGFMHATAWMNCWFAEADGNTWGNTPTSGTEFSLTSEGTAWSCWFPEVNGSFYVTVNTANGWWSAALIDTLSVCDTIMTYNMKAKAWQLVKELDGETTLSFAARAKVFDTSTGTAKDKATPVDYSFGFKEDTLTIGKEGSVVFTGTGIHTISVSINDDGYYVYKVEAGDQTQGDEPSVPKPTELKIYDKDKTTVLTTLARTANGVYGGELTADWGWYNFLLYDAKNNIWYGSDPADATTLSSAEGFYNLWIQSGETGIYTIEVNLNTMSWTYERKGDLPPTVPEALYLYGEPDWSKATATLAKTGDGTYTAEVTISADGNFKIVDGSVWYGLDPTDNTKLSSADGNWNIWLTAGTYTITVNWSTMTFSATKKTE
jgi:hypothetical protein